MAINKPVKLKNFTSEYNGQKVKWFIGDIGFQHAIDIGCAKRERNKQGHICGRITDKEGFIWEAWGSCNGKAYQLFAYCSRRRRKWWQFWIHSIETFYIQNPSICTKEGDVFFDKPTYYLLSRPNKQTIN